MTKPLARLATGWENFWFSAATPQQLGSVRIAFFSTLFLLVCLERFAAKLGTYPASFWHPVWIIAKVTPAPPGYPLLRELLILWRVALFTSAIGLLTRLSTIVSAGLGLYFIGLSNSYGVTSHGHTPVVLCLLVLAVSSCGDGFSVDAWRSAGTIGVRASDGRYHWPIQTLRTIWCLVFFAAGTTKLVESGLSWIFSDNLATKFLLAPYRYPATAAASMAPGLGAWLAQSSSLCAGLALLSVCSEIMAPLALFSGGAACFLIPLMCGLQIAIYFTMFENFIWFLPLYFAWWPLRWPKARCTLTDSASP